MKVCKFGGTSLANAEQIKKVCDIISSDCNRKIAIISAPGKRFKDDSKVTDLLIKLADAYISSQGKEVAYNNVIERFFQIINDFKLDLTVIDEIEKDLKSRLSKKSEHLGKFVDLIKAAGEDYSARIVAKYLQSQNVEAHYINPKDAGLMLSSEFGNARVLPESFENLKKLKNMTGILVFPGFFGYSKEGEVVTFPRGGSDITGSIIAAAVDAELYENFTDVDSVFAANPNVIDNPKCIDEISYKEMRELSYAGFSVLHEETLEFVYKKNIPVRILNTNNPAANGTLITPKRTNLHIPVAGIAHDDDFCSLYIEKYMMNREVGFGRKVLQILEDAGVSYEHMPSGIDNISIIIKGKYLDGDKEMRLVQKINEQLRPDAVRFVKGLSLVMVVGEGMQNIVGMAARATNAISNAKVNIEMINQGSSEESMMFAVKTKVVKDAVRALYEEFFNY